MKKGLESAARGKSEKWGFRKKSGEKWPESADRAARVCNRPKKRRKKSEETEKSRWSGVKECWLSVRSSRKNPGRRQAADGGSSGGEAARPFPMLFKKTVLNRLQVGKSPLCDHEGDLNALRRIRDADAFQRDGSSQK